MLSKSMGIVYSDFTVGDMAEKKKSMKPLWKFNLNMGNAKLQNYTYLM